MVKDNKKKLAKDMKKFNSVWKDIKDNPEYKDDVITKFAKAVVITTYVLAFLAGFFSGFIIRWLFG